MFLGRALTVPTRLRRSSRLVLAPIGQIVTARRYIPFLPDSVRNRRTWSDGDLVVAVRNARSWRGVLRNLGLYPDGPTHVVRREAERLALDVSHFGSGLRCTDAELIAALVKAASWTELLSSLGMRPESRRSKEKVKARAAQLSLSLDHLARPGRVLAREPAALSDLAPQLAHLRDAAQSLAMAWFLLRGLWPANPIEPRPYDLLVDTPTGVKRVQVKTTTSRATSGSWQVRIARHGGGGDRHDRMVPYRADEIDLFVIIDGELMLYLIPLTAVMGRTQICLGPYSEFIVGSATSLFGEKPREFKPRQRRPAVGSVRAGQGRPDWRPGGTSEHAARWTADELRTAVGQATSWADLLRLFGYQPSSTGARQALRRDLQHYGIETNHFVGQRTWSDEALIAAAATAGTWAELLDALGLSASSRSCDSVRSAARRLGVELRVSLGPKVGRQAIDVDLPDRPEPECLRKAAPSIAAAWFMLCGGVVSTPGEGAAYDLIVDMPSGLTRVQVKSTTLRDARGGWFARIGHRPDGSPRTADLVPYDIGEVDLFLVVDGDLRLYLVPATAVAGKVSLSLRGYGEFVVGDASSLVESIGLDQARAG
jgi:PD-(D/E)XK endonuclease